MRKITKLLCVLLAAAMIVACFAGCSSGKSGKTLTYAINADVDDFNPFTQQLLIYTRIIGPNCFEGLFHLNGDMEYEADLATSWEQVDELNYTFKLREGVTFHNGEKFTAEDVKYTIEYAKDEANGSYRGTYFSTVESIECPDEYTVNIKLSEPTPAFLDAIAAQAIVCKSVDPATMSSKPIGTGPFKFVSWTPNDNITFEKFDKYWDAANVKVDKLVLKPFTDQTVALTNLEAGTVDLVYDLLASNAVTLETKTGVQILTPATSNAMNVFEIGRHNCEPLSDPEVMKAIFLALDRQTICDQVFYGYASKAYSCFPSGAKFYEKADDYDYDLDAAKSTLAATKYADGFEFELMVLNGDTTSEQMAVIWQQALSQIGVTMNINKCEMSVWLDAYLGRTYDMIANDYSMVGSDPATCCAQILYPLCDYQAADIPEFKGLIEEAKATVDENVRSADYAKIQELVAQYKPVAFTVERAILFAASEKLQGVVINGMGWTFLKNAAVGA